MNVVSYQTALALKGVGLPQPTPQPGMMFYLDNALCMLCCIRHDGVEMELQVVGSSEKYYPGKEILSIIGVFAPDANYIIPLLKNGIHKELNVSYAQDGTCFVSSQNFWVASGVNLSEAVADLYLGIEQNAPTSDFSKMGDVAQE